MLKSQKTGRNVDATRLLPICCRNYVKEADEKNKDVFGTNFFGIPVTKKLIISSSGSGTEAAFSQFNNLDKINAEFTITPRKSDDTAKKNEVTYDIVVKLSTGTGRVQPCSTQPDRKNGSA